MTIQARPISEAPAERVNIAARQHPLRALYHQSPAAAQIIDHAATSADNIAADHPLGTSVIPGTGMPDLRIGVHKAVGGDSDFPVPGEIFAAAIAACLDSAIRMIANLLGTQLVKLEVNVSAHVDVRGTLMVDKTVPVGFQLVDLTVDIEGGDGVSDEQINRLLKLAERSCVVLQTLRSPPEIRIDRRSAGTTG